MFKIKNNCEVLLAVVGIAGWQPQTNAQIVTVDLGSSKGFAVLASSTIANTGTTIVNGDLGVSPGTTISGFTFGVVNGTIYVGGGVAAQAQTDALTAYNALAGEAPNTDLTGTGLGGLTLTPGVYHFTSTAQLTGTLTLNAESDPNARFDFQIGSTLTTAAASLVTLINGAQANNIFWKVGSSATLGAGTNFSGSILADASITLNTGVDLSGSAFALTGAVTLDSDAIGGATPEPAETSALIAGFFGLLIGVRRIRSIAARRVAL
jgi:type VI secretion system secreted protein VgrG